MGQNTRTLKDNLIKIPVAGYILRLGWAMARLPKHLDRIAQETKRTTDELNTLRSIEEQNAADFVRLAEKARQNEDTFQQIEKRQAKLDNAIVDVKHRLLAASLQSSTKTTEGGLESNGSDLFADDHDLDDFYVKFENKFRGTEEEIKDRLRVYVPRFKELGVDFNKHPVLDIGCGRGELLELFKEEGINTIGLDLNEAMVKRCNDRGLTAVQAEALEYLSKQETGSLGAITGFHIVEHIPFSFLLRLFEECYRVLTPGGIVLFETPNPESLHVGSFSFYYDPSHLHPLVPDVLAFAIENRGFDKVDILRLHPKGEDTKAETRDDDPVTEVVRRFFMEQDYAVIGQKKA